MKWVKLHVELKGERASSNNLFQKFVLTIRQLIMKFLKN